MTNNEERWLRDKSVICLSGKCFLSKGCYLLVLSTTTTTTADSGCAPVGSATAAGMVKARFHRRFQIVTKNGSVWTGRKKMGEKWLAKTSMCKAFDGTYVHGGSKLSKLCSELEMKRKAITNELLRY
ncbi:unnamed protein product [Dovyalis caffra]|uniref:Uncharacterized protein n=1 Tax=Dovyalis caffra TaxID=77055 RepID=A0AAV1QU17_9ROSI|nr:unnamed protein product [Dovyalis caffra]